MWSIATWVHVGGGALVYTADIVCDRTHQRERPPDRGDLRNPTATDQNFVLTPSETMSVEASMVPFRVNELLILLRSNVESCKNT